MTLDELGRKHNTDKATNHKFCDFYEEQLPKKIDRLLEIGVFRGGSLKMWAEYYPDAEIIGIDITKPMEVDGATCLKLDATDVEALRELGEFDIIVDDGSHLTKDQQITFNFLYQNNLKEGGHYVMEDIHTLFKEEYINSKYTTYEILQKMDNVTYHDSKGTQSDSFTAIIKK